MTYREKKRSLFFGLPLSFTYYTVAEEIISVSRGIFNKVEDDAYMYKIVDVRLEESLLQRLFGLGTLQCYGGDTTHPRLNLVNIRRAREIKNYIVSQSEKERIARQTVNTMQIDGGGRAAMAFRAGEPGQAPGAGSVPPR